MPLLSGVGAGCCCKPFPFCKSEVTLPLLSLPCPVLLRHVASAAASQMQMIPLSSDGRLLTPLAALAQASTLGLVRHLSETGAAAGAVVLCPVPLVTGEVRTQRYCCAGLVVVRDTCWLHCTRSCFCGTWLGAAQTGGSAGFNPTQGNLTLIGAPWCMLPHLWS